MKKIFIYIIFFTLLEYSSIYSAQVEDLNRSIENFLTAETTEARSMLSGFSNQFLESYSDQYRQSLKPEEARKLWLLEESYKRKADKVAADRLFYVFLAVSLLMILIFALTLRIYQMQKKIAEMD